MQQLWRYGFCKVQIDGQSVNVVRGASPGLRVKPLFMDGETSMG